MMSRAECWSRKSLLGVSMAAGFEQDDFILAGRAGKPPWHHWVPNY
jgi:hypothetical protein